MHLASLRLRNFRNHQSTQLEFGDGVNILVGNNGQGKTNILEAISYLSLTKSFLSANDGNVCRNGEDLFDVTGMLVSDNEVEYTVRAAHQRSTGEKVFTINKQGIESRSSIIGKFPIVILSPHHSAITFGVPGERRTFIDFVLCQSSRSYLEDMQAFRRILKQRNSILYNAKIYRRQLDDSIEEWNEQIIETSAKVTFQRLQFIEQFKEYVAEAYAEIVGGAEIPSLVYKPQIAITNDTSLDEIKKIFRETIAAEKSAECAAGTTLTGPHHDEIVFSLNDLELRKYASQGQHKTFLVALKVAEFHYLKNICRETPIFLLDDVFSELDERRSQHVLGLVRKYGQTFVTTTNANVLDAILSYNGENKKFTVESGGVSIAAGNLSLVANG